MAKDKLIVSSEWTREEREEVERAIRAEIEKIEREEADARREIQWEAPCFAEWRHRKLVLTELIELLETSSSRFLEENRRNYRDFVAV